MVGYRRAKPRHASLAVIEAWPLGTACPCRSFHLLFLGNSSCAMSSRLCWTACFELARWRHCLPSLPCRSCNSSALAPSSAPTFRSCSQSASASHRRDPSLLIGRPAHTRRATCLGAWSTATASCNKPPPVMASTGSSGSRPLRIPHPSALAHAGLCHRHDPARSRGLHCKANQRQQKRGKVEHTRHSCSPRWPGNLAGHAPWPAMATPSHHCPPSLPNECASAKTNSRSCGADFRNSEEGLKS